jgi:hypothetical protein
MFDGYVFCVVSISSKVVSKTLVVNNNFLELVLGIRDALIFTYPFWVITGV